MATTTTYRPRVATGRDGFGQLLRAEWTKLRSVRRWVLGLLAMVPLTLMLSLFTAAGSGTDINDHPDWLGPIGPDGERVRDEFHFVHRPLTGDGTVTAQVLSQTDQGAPRPDGEDGTPPGNDWVKAGVMIKEDTVPGSRYAAIMVTPGHGTRLQANFTSDIAGDDASRAPRWLRLTRAGTTITGYESADGASWRQVGEVDLGPLPETVQVGLFVASPDQQVVERSIGASSVGQFTTRSTATFDNVRVDAASQSQPAGDWQSWIALRGGQGPTEPGEGGSPATDDTFTEDGGVFTVTGSGDIGPNPPEDDVVQLSLLGVNLGLIAAAAVGVLFITAEFKRGMIRTTFAASPRRGRVLVAKAVVLGSAAFAVGLVASLLAFLVSQPVLRASGFGPPAYPVPSLTDGPVLRTVVGAAAFLALVAVFGLGLGATLRRSAAAITAVIMLFLLTPLLISGLPVVAAQWLMRATPAAGLAILQAVERDHNLAVDPWNMASPWAGLGVLAAWTVAALAIAVWLTRRRDA